MYDLEYSAMSQEQLLHVVQAKDAEIERLKGDINRQKYVAQSEIERAEDLQLKVDDLWTTLRFERDRTDRLVLLNAKLQAVVDAAKAYCEKAQGGALNELREALAALEPDADRQTADSRQE